MPSNRTVAVVVVYTGKNTVNAMLLFLSVREKKEKERERERNSKMKEKKIF
jgi:hypothetical protein